MSAGTITLTNKSAVVSGNGTSFTTELAAGDFIVATVGGIAYTLPVLSIASATSLTLVSNFTGPTQSGNAWNAVPRVALNMVTAALVTQSAEALRGLNYDKQNWQSVFTGTGTITLTLPDGSTFSGPSWKYLSDNMATKSGGAVPITQGGTGSTTAAGARLNLALGSSATRDVDLDLIPTSMQGNKIQITAHRDFRTVTSYNYPHAFPAGLSGGLTNGALVPGMGQASTAPIGLLNVRAWNDNSAGASCFQILCNDIKFGYRPTYYSASDDLYLYSKFREIYHTNNTTKSSDGTLKAASPVVQVYTDGSFQLNDESEGCTVSRLSVGEYLIEGCTGLNADAAWGGIDGGFDIPTDRNKQPLVWLDYEVNADGSILVRTYHRTYPTAPVFARNERDGIEEGEPVDIPADQFVSVRVEMPSDSIWNQKQEEAIDAMMKFEPEKPTDLQQD